jgi:hypothetical protein
LELVADVLTHPSDMLHWLGRRGEIDRTTWLTGDEMDLLGLYLDTGFNLGENEFKLDLTLNVTGMSEPVDEWQYRQQAGMDAEKPTVKRIEWWEECLTRVEQRRRPGWTEIGVAMCHVPPPEQRKLLAAMHAFRDDVVAGRRSSKEFLVFHNGPEQRRTLIVGLIATSPKAAQREEQFRMAARVALQETRAASVVLMSWTPFPSESPYLGIGLARSG